MRIVTPIIALCATTFAASTVDVTVTKGTKTLTTPAPSINQLSALQALDTVLPTSLRNLAITRPAAAESVIISEFAHGSTPAWFTKLPTAIQSYLRPVTTIVQAPSIVLSAVQSQGTVLKNATVVPLTSSMSKNMTMMYPNSTMTSTKHSTSSTKQITTSSKALSSTGAGTTTTSAGGAAIPTAIAGGALAGIFGLLGVFAL